MATIIDKGNYVEIDRGETPDTKRYVVKPFSVVVCLPNIVELRDALGNKWGVDSTVLTGFTFADIYDLKEQVMLLNNKYEVNATITATIGEVEISNDLGNPIPTRETLVSNSFTYNISASLSEITLRAQNAARKELIIHNKSNGILYVLKGAGVTSTNFTEKLNLGDSMYINDYRGVVTGLCDNIIGFAMVTETYY